MRTKAEIREAISAFQWAEMWARAMGKRSDKQRADEFRVMAETLMWVLHNRHDDEESAIAAEMGIEIALILADMDQEEAAFEELEANERPTA